MLSLLHSLQQPSNQLDVSTQGTSVGTQLLSALRRTGKAQLETALAHFELAAVYFRWLLEGGKAKENAIDILSSADSCVQRALLLFFLNY